MVKKTLNFPMQIVLLFVIDFIAVFFGHFFFLTTNFELERRQLGNGIQVWFIMEVMGQVCPLLAASSLLTLFTIVSGVYLGLPAGLQK